MSDLPLFDPFKALEEARRESVGPSRKLPQKLPQAPAEANREHPQQLNITSATSSASAGVPVTPVLAHAPVQKEEEEKIQSFHILTRGQRGVDEATPVRTPTRPAETAETAEVHLSACDEKSNPKIASAEVLGGDLRKWIAAIEGLSPDTIPCPDYRLAEWARVRARALDFLDRFGAQAIALGWTAPRLFAVHPVAGIVRVDACGALVLPIAGEVRAITATEISFGHLTHRTKPGETKGVPVWRFGR